MLTALPSLCRVCLPSLRLFPRRRLPGRSHGSASGAAYAIRATSTLPPLPPSHTSSGPRPGSRNVRPSVTFCCPQQSSWRGTGVTLKFRAISTLTIGTHSTAFPPSLPQRPPGRGTRFSASQYLPQLRHREHITTSPLSWWTWKHRASAKFSSGIHHADLQQCQAAFGPAPAVESSERPLASKSNLPSSETTHALQGKLPLRTHCVPG